MNRLFNSALDGVGKRRARSRVREEASTRPVRVVSDSRRVVENNKTFGGVIDLGEKPASKESFTMSLPKSLSKGEMNKKKHEEMKKKRHEEKLKKDREKKEDKENKDKNEERFKKWKRWEKRHEEKLNNDRENEHKKKLKKDREKKKRKKSRLINNIEGKRRKIMEGRVY